MTFWKKFGRAAAMVTLAFALASCEHVETPTEVGAEESVAEYEGEPQELLSGLLGGLLGTNTIQVRAIDQYGVIRTYSLVQEPLLSRVLGTVVRTVDGLLAIVTDLIGVNGGILTNLGHTLVVPRGAVDGPTTFSLGVLLNGTVQVDLTAYAPGGSGKIDVGAEGFDRPVRLDMTYSRADVRSRDEGDLVVLRLNPAGLGALHEVVPATIDERNEKASVWLEHFSKYAMAL